MKTKFSFEEGRYLNQDQMQAFFELMNGFEYVDKLTDDGVAFVKTAIKTLEVKLDILNDHAARLDEDMDKAVMLLDAILADLGDNDLKNRLECVKNVLAGEYDEN